MISADKERIIQLITILVDNAIKYSFVQQEINVYLKCRDENIEFSVEDRGQGISEKDKEKIFERFFRVDKDRSKLTGGFGLGLPIALWIIQAHGGKIEVTTKLKKGSCFKVFLPLD